MKATSHAELSFSQVLAGWLTHRITQAKGAVKAAIRPAHRADHIAAVVAASNNPSGT
jgi:hypothetical protein